MLCAGVDADADGHLVTAAAACSTSWAVARTCRPPVPSPTNHCATSRGRGLHHRTDIAGEIARMSVQGRRPDGLAQRPGQDAARRRHARAVRHRGRRPGALGPPHAGQGRRAGLHRPGAGLRGLHLRCGHGRPPRRRRRRPHHPARSSVCRSRAVRSTAWTPSTPRCRCPRASPWPPSPSTASMNAALLVVADARHHRRGAGRRAGGAPHRDRRLGQPLRFSPRGRARGPPTTGWPSRSPTSTWSTPRPTWLCGSGPSLGVASSAAAARSLLRAFRRALSSRFGMAGRGAELRTPPANIAHSTHIGGFFGPST